MADVTKCASPTALGADPGAAKGALTGQTLEARALEKYCGAAIEGTTCFNKAAMEYNSIVDDINAIGKKPAPWAGTGLIVDGAFDKFGVAAGYSTHERS